MLQRWGKALACVVQVGLVSGAVAQVPAKVPARMPIIALLATELHGEETSLIFQEVNAAPAPPVVRFHHLSDSAVSGTVVPGTATVVAVADLSPARDRSWAGSLFLLQAGQPPRELVDHLYHSGRPLAVGKRIFVERGHAGPPVTEKNVEEGRLREDAVSIDEVGLSTGAARPILSFKGYTAFLAGSFGNELIVYRVGYEQADIVAVNINSGAVRTVASPVLPFARDFSVDSASGTMVFTNRSNSSASQWEVQHLDLKTGDHKTLKLDSNPHLAPHVWVNRQFVYSPNGSGGLTHLGKSTLAPMGPGVDMVKNVFVHGKENWATALHFTKDNLAVPFALQIQTGKAFPIPVPPNAQVDIAGTITVKP